MTTKPKPRKAPAADIFALIEEHKALIKEKNCLEDKFKTADGLDGALLLYDQWNSAVRAARIAGKALARMKPRTLAGLAALLDYTRQSYADEINEDWAEIAFKTCAAALNRMVAA
jgi:hypothetical protein